MSGRYFHMGTYVVLSLHESKFLIRRTPLPFLKMYPMGTYDYKPTGWICVCVCVFFFWNSRCDLGNTSAILGGMYTNASLNENRDKINQFACKVFAPPWSKGHFTHEPITVTMKLGEPLTLRLVYIVDHEVVPVWSKIVDWLLNSSRNNFSLH